MKDYLSAATALVILAVVILLVRSELKRYRSYLEELAKSLDQPQLNGGLNMCLSAQYRGYPVQIRPPQGGKNKPAYIIINLTKDSRLAFTVHKNSWIRKLLGKFRSGSNPKTGDPFFDRKFTVTVSDPILGQSLLLKPDVREAIDQIMKRGFSFVRLKKGKFTTRKSIPVYLIRSAFEADSILPVLDAFVLIAQALSE